MGFCSHCFFSSALLVSRRSITKPVTINARRTIATMTFLIISQSHASVSIITLVFFGGLLSFIDFFVLGDYKVFGKVLYSSFFKWLFYDRSEQEGGDQLNG